MLKPSMNVSGRREKSGQKMNLSRRQQGIRMISEEWRTGFQGVCEEKWGMSRDWPSNLCWGDPKEGVLGAVRFELKLETGRMLCDPVNVPPI